MSGGVGGSSRKATPYSDWPAIERQCTDRLGEADMKYQGNICHQGKEPYVQCSEYNFPSGSTASLHRNPEHIGHSEPKCISEQLYKSRRDRACIHHQRDTAHRGKELLQKHTALTV